jgi:cytoskeleton protein RodZ
VFEIGTSLREVRLRHEIEIAEAEQGTKIRAKYLRALEDEQFEVLPSPTYVKGFLRSYAEYLGLDGQLYVDEYNSRYVVEENEAPFRARKRRDTRGGGARFRQQRRFESGAVLLTLGGIAVVTALVIAAWKFGGSTNPQKIQNLGTTSAAVAPAAAAPRRLVIRAVRGASLLEVHLGSPTGKLLFQGTLEPGRSQSFPARTVWLNAGSADNLRITLGGRSLTLPRTHGPSRLLVTRAGRVRAA